jgi:hypothetical protein
MMRLLTSTLALLACGCGNKCPEPQYEGKASDEAYLTMVDAEQRATADGMKAAQLQLADGAVLPSDTLPTFTWTSTLASASPRFLGPPPRHEQPWWRGLLISESRCRASSARSSCSARAPSGFRRQRSGRS